MKNQIDRMTKLLDELRQTIEELDCEPVECSACVNTDDMAYIELPIDGDGTARSISDWAFALEVLMALARSDWSPGELYTAFQTVMNNTNPFEDRLPDWEEVEALIEEQSRLRDSYFNLLYFLENPDEYADFLHREVKNLTEKEGMARVIAKAKIASEAMKSLQEEVSMAYGEKATPRFYQMYLAHLAEGGEDIEAWFSRWLATV